VINLFLNEDLLLSIDKNTRLTGVQRRFIDEMDAGMDRGVRVNARLISNSSPQLKCEYVVAKLITAVSNTNASLIKACKAYLLTRKPLLTEIRVTTKDQSYRILFIE